MAPAILFGCLLRDLLSKLMPALPAAILCGCILLAAEGLFILALGLARPQWVKVLVRK